MGRWSEAGNAAKSQSAQVYRPIDARVVSAGRPTADDRASAAARDNSTPKVTVGHRASSGGAARYTWPGRSRPRAGPIFFECDISMKRHLFAFLAGATVTISAFAQSAPVDIVRNAVEGTVNAMKADPAARGGDMAKVTQIVDARFLPATNFERTTRIAVGDAWKQATPQQQQALYAQFKLLMTRTYAASLAQLGGQDAKFSFKPGGASGTDALVQSTVTTPGDSQSVGDRLGKVGNDWKIFDMSGAWLIQVYQGQFRSQLAQGGIDGLIAFLTKHNARTN
jgi:phospholipid transport system substrate-binding protein